MQRNVLNQTRVKVFKVKIYDVLSDEFRVSRRMATECGAERMRGQVIPNTEILINADDLELGEQWTKIDFIPNNKN